ncbi:hypothetical protein CwatDRAFT_2539 [Crocosphaera watsonii WH 8501]|uniref:Transposase n=1 Tax=Crocosphaera watsonii WH 8501 TaxID=165597 RepID=Q4C0V9_CROWT|nr:hypothetical protein CwatDRAFT_2539 [Crocosphaera watsonii WH 8501]
MVKSGINFGETFSANPKVGYQKGYNRKIKDLDNFKQFVQIHGSKTQEEMAEIWPTPVSDRTIGKALKKIGYTRKKKLTDIEREMRKKDKNLGQKSEQRRKKS